MEDRETPRMHKYGGSKTTRIMITVRHVTAWAGRTKYQADGFLMDGVYVPGNSSYKWELNNYPTNFSKAKECDKYMPMTYAEPQKAQLENTFKV